MTILGLQMVKPMLKGRHGQVAKRPKQVKQAATRGLMHEGLETRQLLAVDLAALDLQAGSDTGVSDSDNITAQTNVTFDVNYSNATTAGELVQLRLNGPAGALLGEAPVPAVGAGTISIATSILPLPEGTNTIFAVPSTGIGVQSTLPVTVDTTAPTVTIEQGATQADPTATLSILFDVVFSEPVSGFDETGITLSGTASLTSSLVSVAGSGTTYTVTVTAASATDGTVIATVDAGAATDVAGNANVASSSADNSVTIDQTAPTVAVAPGGTQANPTNALPIVFDVVFSEPVTGFVNTDVTISGTALTTPVVTVSGSGTTYTVSVTAASFTDGTVIATVIAGAAIDVAGNVSLASTSTDNQVTINQSLPSRTITVTANDTNIAENAPTNAQFTLNMDNSSAAPVVVTFTTNDGIDISTADAYPAPFADYKFGPQVTSLGGNLYSVTVPANTTSFVFDADILDDNLYDPNETIVITLVSATNTPAMDSINVLNGPAAGRTTTILDDEAQTNITIAGTMNAVEGDPGTAVNGQFTVNLSTPLDADTTLQLTIGGTATWNSDYTFGVGSVVGGTELRVDIPAGATSVVIPVNVLSQPNTVELTETVVLTPAGLINPPVAPPAGTILLGGAGSITIADDDTASVSITATDGAEGGPDGSFTVGMGTQSSSTNTVVNFTVTNGPDAVFGVDYWLTYPVIDSDLTLTSSSNTGSFATNDTLATAQNVDGANWNSVSGIPSIQINGGWSVGDTYDYYSVSVGAGQNLTATTSPSFRVALYRTDGTLVAAGNGGGPVAGLPAGTYIVGVARVGATASPGGFTNNPLQPGDMYTLNLSVTGHATPMPTSITIPAGQTAATMTLAIIDDNLLESDELVTVSLTSMGVADPEISLAPIIGLTNPRVATSTISDNDEATVKLIGTGTNFNMNIPGVAVNPIEPGANGRFTVVLLNPSDDPIPSDEDIVVPFEIASISDAEYGVDYEFGAGVSGMGTKLDPFRVTIPANATSAPILINVINDDAVEDDESIVLNLLDIPVVLVTDPNRALVGPGGDDQVTLSQPLLGPDQAASFDPLDPVIYSVTGSSAGVSQFDSTLTSPDFPNFATIYENFTLGAAVTQFIGLTWVGSYESATSPALNPTFTITIYQDNGLGEPGAPLTSANVGTANETALGDGYYQYNDVMQSSPLMVPGGNYWVSIVANVTLPSTWGVAYSGDEGAMGVGSIQDFQYPGDNFITREFDPIDYAITVFAAAADSVQVKDEDLAVVTVNSNIDTAVEGGANGQFTIQLSKASAAETAILPLIPVTSNVDTVVTYTLTGTAANPQDISNDLSGTITIPAGASSVTLDINALLDNLNEPVETVVMTITSITQGDADVSLDPTRLSDTVFVVDANTTAVTVSTLTPVTSEVGPMNGSFTFELLGDALAPAAAVEVTYSFSGTATFGADFTTPGFTGKITIPAGMKTAVLPIEIVAPDSLVEGTETVQVKIDSVKVLSGPTGGVDISATNTADLIILDADSSAVTVTASDPVIGEGTDDGEFTISLSTPIATGLFVNYTITNPDPDGPPDGPLGLLFQPVSLDGSDFTLEDELGNPLPLPGGSIFIPPNVNSFKIKVKVVDDALLETWLERIQLNLTSTGNAAVSVGSPGSAFMDILPDQTVSVAGNADATEGGKVGSFKIELARASTTDTFVSYSLTGTATEGTDYASPGGVAKITAGDTYVLVPIDATTVGNDLIPEVTETVKITLDSVTNVAPDAGADITLSATKEATINILDDDLAYVTIAATDRSEGDAAGLVMFTLTLRDINGNPVVATENVTVSYTTGGSATPVSDFALTPAGTATISKNSSSTNITVNVVNDNLLEGTETVSATMGTVSGSLAGQIKLSSIVGPTLNFVGTEDTYIDPLQPFANLDTQGINVTAGLNPQQGLLRFGNLFGPGAGQIPAGAQINAANLNLTSVGAGSVNLHNMLVPWTEALTWASSSMIGDGMVGIQANGIDATVAAVASGVVNSANVTNSVLAWQANPAANFGWALLPNAGSISYSDSESANPPALSVTLSTSATANIFDNDGGEIKITNIQGAKEESTDGIVTITLPSVVAPGHTVLVEYTVGGAGTATAGSDYVPVTAIVPIPAGQQTATFPILVLGDDLIEGTETVQVKLNSFSVSGLNAASIASLLTIDTDPLMATIEDDDTTTATVSVLVSGDEGPALPLGSHTDPIFRVSLGKTSTQPTVINFTLTGDTTPGQDYVVPSSNQVTIPAGSLFTDVKIDLIDDEINELDETLIFTLTSVASGPGVTIGAGNVATDTIQDDDALTVTIAATDPTAMENPTSNTGTFTFGVQASDKVTTVPFTITGTADTATLPLVFPVGGVTNISGPDYSLQAGTNVVFTSLTGGLITFPASTTPQTTTIVLTAVQDYLGPQNVPADSLIETVSITLGAIGNDNNVPPPLGAGSSATVNIIDEDFSVKIEKTASFAQEDGAGNGGLNGQFTVTIANPTLPGDDVTVPFTIPNTGDFGTATYGADYLLTGIGVFVDSVTFGSGGQVVGRAVIAGGTTTRLITVTVLPDNLVEGPEDIVITIGNPVDTNTHVNPQISGQLSTLGSPSTATETIIDDDAPTLKVTVMDDITSLGTPDIPGIGEAGMNPGAFRFELDQVIPGVDTIITYQIVPASTTASPSDYTLSGTFGTVTIPGGSSFATVLLTPVDDNLVEGDETLTLKIVLATASTFPITIDALAGEATATIVDNDVATVSITAIDADAREPSNPGVFEVKLSKPSQTETVITYTVGGSARPGTAPGLFAAHDPFDYQELSGTVTIPANALTATILVDVFDDDIVEDDETVVATLNAATNNPLVTASGNATVIIGADPGAGQDVTVATISKTLDATEGGLAGIFSIALTKAADEDITFPILVNHITTTAADITIPTSVTVLKGTLGTTFSVVANDDSVVEGNETFSVTLGTPTAAFVSPVTTALVTTAGNPTMTVIDNDTNVLKISVVDVIEGDTDTQEMIFTVESPNAVKAGFTVPYFLSGGTANTGMGAGNTDFDAGDATGSLSFTGAAGQKQTFSVTVFGDLVVENDETIEITLGTVTSLTPSVPAQITSGAKATGTIINNDTAVFEISNASIVEGNDGGIGGLTEMQFNITIAGGYTIDEAVAVSVSFVDGTASGLPIPVAGPVDEGTDYDSTPQEISFGAYSTGETFKVKIVGDTRVEGMQNPLPTPVITPDGKSAPDGFETFTVKMATTTTKSTNVSDTAIGSIIDDDTAVVSVSSAAVDGGDNLASEPGAGFGSGKFVFMVTNPVQADVVITYSYTVDGAAGDPNGDLVAPLSGTITIPGGVANTNKSVVLDINVFDDDLVEDNEDVVITITSITTDPSVTFSAAPATVTILDDDVATISIKATDNLAQEPGPGLNEGTATYEVFLSKLSDAPTTVNLGIVAAGTTASPSDYKGLPATVTIPAGQLSMTFEIEAIQDGIIEPTETLQVELLNPVSGHPNIIITSDKAFQSDTISILDAGTGVFVSIDTSKTIDAFEEGTKNGEFVIRITDNLGNPITLAQNVTVNYTVAGSTAISPDDYAGLPNIVVIPAGQSTAPVAVQPVDDSLVEGTEFVNLTINDATIAGGGTVFLGTAATPALPINEQVDIIDNDFVPATVEAITINGGAAQRSNLRTMTVQFDSMVVLQPGALTVQRRSDVSPVAPPVGNVGGVNVTTALVSGKTVATLTFTPNSAFVDATGSLVDGNYQITIDPSLVLTGGFTPMVPSPTDATGGDMVFGDEGVDGVYRLYGDVTGVETAAGGAFVDVFDLIAFENAFGSQSTDANFDQSLDVNDDGFIDVFDLIDFENNFGLGRNLGGF